VPRVGDGKRARGGTGLATRDSRLFRTSGRHRGAAEEDDMTADNTSTVDQEIRSLIESCARAIRAKDADAVAAHYAPDFVAFDMAPPLRLDRAEYKQSYARWFASIEGPIDYEIRELQIVASGDEALCSTVNRVKSTAKSGEKHDGWVRVTLGVRKINGKWLAAHEHVSVPFDMTTGKAITNLAP
jgi:uncharacterized protein (TIGR02246 family)